MVMVQTQLLFTVQEITAIQWFAAQALIQVNLLENLNAMEFYSNIQLQEQPVK